MSGPNQVRRLLLVAAGASLSACARDDSAPTMTDAASTSNDDVGVSLATDGSKQLGQRVAAKSNNLLGFFLERHPANTTVKGRFFTSDARPSGLNGRALPVRTPRVLPA